MTEITRAEFDALRQKVEEIHRMLVNMGGQSNVVMVQPYTVMVQPSPAPPWVVTCQAGQMPENQPLPRMGHDRAPYSF